ncbi:MAG: hypothetical protein GY851_24265 [bacterium]|nr:hypothetical protein [bacterium]
MNPTLLSDLAAGATLSDWLILGPFVVRTEGHFEREYMYERERILDIDYLAGDGGEAAVQPEAGAAHENIGVGPKHLAWRSLVTDDLNGNRIAGDAIYETVQRNCVIYAATCVESDMDCHALLDAYHSGMKVWVNGQLVCNEPYGLPKGVRITMPSKLIELKKGRNLVLVKFRPGYIADGIDFRVRDVRIAPLIAERGLPIALGRVRPLPYFTGTLEEPRQVIEAAIVNTSHVTAKVSVSVTSDTLDASDKAEVVCDPEQTTIVRLGLHTPKAAAGEPVKALFRARLFGREVEAPFEYEAAKPPTHDGTTMVQTRFHFDTTYHEEQRVYAMGAFDIVRQYCRLLREDPNFRATLSEVDYLKPYFDMFPEDRETLLQAFAENRAASDCMYNQPNEQTCGGEALVRNFLYGQLFTGGVMGQACMVYSPEDVFGHPNQLSQIARKSGCIGVMWGKCINNFPPFFHHLALDGVAIPHQRGRATWKDVHYMGLTIRDGDIDQTPSTDWHGDLLPSYQQATPGDIPTEIRRQCEEEDAHLPVTSRDMSLYHAATNMSRTNLKIGNRLGENVLIAAEKFATIASLLGATYPDKALDKAWRQILCGQHHDSITGTHNELSYVDLMNSYREVLELGTDVLNRSLDYLGRAIDPGKGNKQPLVVFNSLAWERTGIVRTTVRPKGVKGFTLLDHAGKNVPFEAVNVKRNKKDEIVSADVAFTGRKLPSLGYRAYSIVPNAKPLPQAKPRNTNSIENEFYRIEVDPARGGGMISLYDKKAKREVLDVGGHVGNEFAILHEVPDRAETQHEFYTTGLAMFSGNQPASVEVEKGPVSATVRARYEMAELCGVVQEITLYKGVKRVEFKTVLVDYQGEDHLFTVTVPTKLKGAMPVFDERFGTVVRNDSKGYLDFRTHRQIMFSDCAVYGANKWMEYGSSAALQVGRNTYALGMVGLIAPEEDTRVAEEVQQVLIKKGITCTPWSDKGGPHWGTYQYHMDEDLLYTRFRLSIGAQGRNAYTRKLLKAQPAKVRKAFEQRLKKDGCACLFVKDGDLLDTSWPALPVLIVEAVGSEELAIALEQMLAEFPSTARIKLPGEIDATGESHRVDDYGVAILNEGTYGNSVEKGGVICMMLAHTCRWYGGTNTFPEGYLVPENKNHVFRYALYPHEGDWRTAHTQRMAHEFNHPLAGRETKPVAKACLPPEEAFLTVAPDNVVLAAMKPYGNPLPAFQQNAQSDPAKGITLRLYDGDGVDSEAHIRFASGISSAWVSNLLEEKEAGLPARDGDLFLYVGPYSIETVGFVPGKLGRKMGGKQLGVEAEPVQPVWVRSWEHDAESMPIGYHSVVCSLGREVHEEDKGRTLVVKVNAVNDYVDGPAKGSAALVLPEGWKAEPAKVSFNLPALGHQVTEVRVHRPESDAAGQIKLRHTFDGQMFQDVLEIGGSFDLDITAENQGKRVEVTVTNPTAETVEGEVSLVTPLETWPGEIVNDYALLEVTPRTQAISLPAGDQTTLTFTVKQAPGAGRYVPCDSYWAVAKLMSNGRITLKRCDNTPVRRMLWDKPWLESYRARAEEYRKRPKK